MLLTDTSRLTPGSRYTVTVTSSAVLSFGQSALQSQVVSVFSGTIFPVDHVDTGFGSNLKLSGIYQGLGDNNKRGELTVAEFKRFALDRIGRIGGVFFETITTVESGGISSPVFSTKTIFIIILLILLLGGAAWLASQVARLAGK